MNLYILIMLIAFRFEHVKISELYLPALVFG